MAIQSLNQLIAAARQNITLMKTATRTTITTAWFSLFELAGNPGGGTLAGTSTTAGVVPTDATAGCPLINAFGGSNTGYVSQFDFSSTVACRIRLYDMVFKAGAYAFNANTNLSSQPSYSARMPGGDYGDTQLWLETVTAFTGNVTITVTYVNQAGTTGRTATLATGTALTVGRMMQIPLQSGDTGVQSITNVTCTVASAGTLNVLVLRPLVTGRVKVANDGDTQGWDKTGAPVIFADSAIFMMVAADSTSSGIPEVEVTIANG